MGKKNIKDTTQSDNVGIVPESAWKIPVLGGKNLADKIKSEWTIRLTEFIPNRKIINSDKIHYFVEIGCIHFVSRDKDSALYRLRELWNEHGE